MRLTCPNCDAQYEVDDSAIPITGRDVQCSNCGHAWFQIHPDTVEAEAAEAAVHGSPPPPPAAPAAPRTVPPSSRVPEADADDDPSDPIGRAPRRIDESVLAVLREEAARETEARRREAARLETQPDLGLAAPPTPPTAVAAAAPAPAPAAAPPQRQRDLLPDIEEINSTLRPGAEARGDAPVGEEQEVAAQRRSGFRSGFLLVVSLAILAAALYVAAPRIGAAVPALSGAMAAYVAGVDAFRLWLDGAVQAAVSAVRSLSGQPG